MEVGAIPPGAALSALRADRATSAPRNPPLRGAVGCARYVSGTVPYPGRLTTDGGSIRVKPLKATA
jgi:hypothetical protein